MLDDLQLPPKRPARRTRERVIESSHRKVTEALGGVELKFVSPGRRGVPDRIKLMPIPAEHRALVARYFRFIEYKRPGAVPGPHQAREHERLRALGFTVDIIDQLPP